MFRQHDASRRSLRLTGALIVALVAGIGGFGALTPASAAPAAAPAPLPETVTADVLPTWQINGVVWSQVTVGNTVYATGSFTKARPAGVPVGGPGEIDARNIFAYDIRTGNPIGFSHSLNAQGLTIQVSPDQSRVYVGGDFTTVDGQVRNHLAAFDVATGSLVSGFTPYVGGQVRGVAFSGNTVYAGGNFYSANGLPRNLFAAFQASNGNLTSWAPYGDGGYVWDMLASPDGSRIIASGSFTTINGTSAYGMGAISAADGSTQPWAANQRLRAAGSNGAINSLSTDGQQIFGTGYAFGAGAQFEGTFGADPMTGDVNWVNDCLGDTYDTFAQGQVLYVTSHRHDCSNIGSFPDTSPRSRWTKANAELTYPTGVITSKNAYGWDFTGFNHTDILDWFPDFDFGSYTSARQAAWSVTGNNTYVAFGGEFPRVNNTAQQGLVRFAKRAAAPKQMGPVYNAAYNPTAYSTESGTVNIAFGSLWDRDGAEITYDVYRDDWTKVASIPRTDGEFWSLPVIAATDTGVTPGSQAKYKIRATDSDGNIQWSYWSNTVTVSDAAPSAYTTAIRADGASHLWKFSEATGPAALDSVGTLVGSHVSLTPGVAGALSGDSAIQTTRSSRVTTSVPEQAPSAVTLEAWVKTTSTRGGRIVGFGDSSAANSGIDTNDRVLYLANNGQVNLMINQGGRRTINSTASVNNGEWHHVVGVVGADGMQLFVDGVRVARDQRYTTGLDQTGYWRIGNDQTSGFANRPSDLGLSGTIDEVAVYPTALSMTKVQSHYTLSARSGSWGAAATGSYATQVLAQNPDLYWRMAAGDSTVADESGSGNRGNTFGAGFLGIGAINFGQPGVVANNAAASFDGSNDLVVAQQSWMAPTNYSAELWFNTTTTSGGKLIGFGNSPSGLSSSYDRHVYMFNDGRLRFGTWNGGAQTVDTANAYNDGNWHHVVATQSSDGMRLYVDSVLVGSNTLNEAQGYLGYWRIGGDRTWGGASSNYFAGTLDEVAVYPVALTEQNVRDHFAAAGQTPVDRTPTAAFTLTQDLRDVSVDASTSSDPDGPLASYTWDFGDDTPVQNGETATHSYAANGTYTVSLTVTDSADQTDTTTKEVTIAGNELPTAAFTATMDERDLSVDGSTSSDADGTIASYSWNFGDDSPAVTGETASHSYTVDGTFTVTLTVTDDRGETGTTTKTVTSKANVIPTAEFTLTKTDMAVAVDASASTDADGTIESYAWDFGDGVTATGVTASHTYTAGGTFTVSLTVTDNQGATKTSTQDVEIISPNQAPQASFTAATQFLEVTVDGSGSSDADGTIASYAWDFGDGSTGTGATDSHAYAAAGSYTVTLQVTDNEGGQAATTKQVTVGANQAPTAAFTSSVSQLTASVDASGSTDADGSVASYAWDFGDGASGTGETDSHSYAATGTYTVTLTVTDDADATDTASADVTVTAPTVVAADAFARTVATGWGSADTGGAWSIPWGSSSFSVGGGKGQMTVPAGSGYYSYLSSVSNANNDLRISVSPDKGATGGGQYLSVIGRSVDGAGDYRAKLRLMSNGGATLYLTRKISGGAEILLASQAVSMTPVAAGDTLNIRFQVEGTGTTALRAKVWKGATEPTSWTATSTDSTAALQTAGSVGVYTYMSGSASNGPVVFAYDDLEVVPLP